MPSIKVLFFGQLSEQVGKSSLDMDEVSSTDEVLQLLKNQYPVLGHNTYQIALDKELISENTSISSGQILALLPPYAGG